MTTAKEEQEAAQLGAAKTATQLAVAAASVDLSPMTAKHQGTAAATLPFVAVAMASAAAAVEHLISCIYVRVQRKETISDRPKACRANTEEINRYPALSVSDLDSGKNTE